MSDRPGTICVISDNPSPKSSGILERMLLTYEVNKYDQGFVKRLCVTNWDLLIIESTYDIQDAIRSCETVRSFKPSSQIIIVSNKCPDSAVSDFFSRGADDHICIPSSDAIFQSRISAALRRSSVMQRMLKEINPGIARGNGFVYPNSIDKTSTCLGRHEQSAELFQILPASKKAIVYGVHITLTKTELSILSHFLKNINKPCEKFEILEHVLGYKDECYLTSLYSHINRLRRKLIKKNLKAIQIQTIWRYGYKLVIS